MDLLKRDVDVIENFAKRFNLSKDTFCLMTGVCNPSETEVKENIEQELQHYLTGYHFDIIKVTLSPGHPSLEHMFSGNASANVVYWLDLVTIEEKEIDLLEIFEQKREILTKKNASIFIITSFSAFSDLKRNAPNFMHLSYPGFFGIESFIEKLRGGLKGEFAGIISKTRDFEGKISRYFTREASKETNYFLNLRRWNSYTPVLRFREGDPRGGGYFLKWFDTGIAIDPGHGFIQNLFECGLGIGDIDVIIITHDHPDHTQEFPLLVDLLFQFNKRKLAGAVKKQFSFLLNASSFAKFAPIIRYESAPNLCQVLWQHKEILLGKNNSIRIRPTHTKHKELGGSEMGVGLLFDLFQGGKKQCSIGITGDTGWTPSLTDEFRMADILIAHLGSVKEEEMLEREFYQNHLGILGLYNLSTQLLQEKPYPRIIILSEFGEELCDSRSKIAGIFQSSVAGKKKTLFLPADIGLKIRLGHQSEIHALCSFANCEEPAQFYEEVVNGNHIAMFCEKHRKGKTV